MYKCSRMMTRSKPHIFLHSIIGVLTITSISSYVLLRGMKGKEDFKKVSGVVIYFDKFYDDLPHHGFGKYRYLKIDNFETTFEIFVGKDFGDFKPLLERVDSLRIGDQIDVYYDSNEKESGTNVNGLIQYIDKSSIPYYKKGNQDKILGLSMFTIGIIGLLTLLILKHKDKIE